MVVSGLLGAATDSPTTRIVDAMLVGACPVVLSESLLAEYREVLLRPAIMERHGLTEVEVDAVLEEMVLNASLREPDSPEHLGEQTGLVRAHVATERAESAPCGDEHLIALLKAVPEVVLVTGDIRLAEAVASWCAVATPAEFAATLVDPAGG